MKILIVSDSHGDVGAIRTAVERERPDRVFHLGDVCADARRLAAASPELPIESVAGNCDAWDSGTEPERLLVTVEGVRFFLSHGHRFHVKLGVGMVVNEGRKANADVVCFGHTHKSMCRQWPDGTWVVNPGSVGGVNSEASYAVAEVEQGEVKLRIECL